MGRETLLTFGKITIVSNGSTLKELEDTLSRVLKKHGYPESSDDADFDLGEEESKLSEMMKKDGSEIRRKDGGDDSGNEDLQDLQEESSEFATDY